MASVHGQLPSGCLWCLFVMNSMKLLLSAILICSMSFEKKKKKATQLSILRKQVMQ